MYFIIGVLVIGLGFLAVLALSQKGQPNTFERELIALAEGIGLDKDQFFEDYKSDEVKNKVQEHVDYGNQIGVNATPSAYINQVPIDIASEYAGFKTTIEQAIMAADELPITLSVFEDYQCPFCSNFFPITYLIEAEFGEDVVVEHYHFPLDNIHPKARRYAYAAEAAALQGKYYEMSRAIFEYEHAKEYPELDLLIEGSAPLSEEDTNADSQDTEDTDSAE